MKVTIGISPCPNDIFIFAALMTGKISSEPFDFHWKIADVEALNDLAFDATLDATKISFHAFGYLTNSYQILNSGAALGRGCGPMLIAKTVMPLSDIAHMRIGIPGQLTTANFLLHTAMPDLARTQPMIFSAIEDAILDGSIDAGVIIHENRFTYARRGLKKILDLGAHWEERTGMPIPLGGIAVSRSMPQAQKKQLQHLIRTSIAYAYANEDEVLAVAKQYAQEMEEDVMRQHIELYVNDFSLDLGMEGRQAIDVMFRFFRNRHPHLPWANDFFV